MTVVNDAIDAAIATLVPYTNAPVYLEGYGEDVAGLTHISDWRKAYTDELLKQQCYRRITTARGTYFGNTEYGIDIQEYLHSRLSDKEIASRIVAELRKDDRIRQVRCECVRDLQILYLDIYVVPRNLQYAGFTLSLKAIIDPTGTINV